MSSLNDSRHVHTDQMLQREFILRYEDLDNRMDPNRSLARVGFPHSS